MSGWDERTLIEDVSARAIDDWLHVADFVAVARRAGISGSEEVRLLALGLIAAVLCEGLLVAGETDELGFHEWEVSPGEAIDRIVELWDPEDSSPSPGSVAWFSNTARGEAVGRTVLERERVSP